MAQKEKRKIGFARLLPEALKAITSLGGKAAQEQGKGRRFDSESGKAAGKKGGARTAQNRQHMSRIGKKGGLARHKGKSHGKQGGNN